MTIHLGVSRNHVLLAMATAFLSLVFPVTGSAASDKPLTENDNFEKINLVENRSRADLPRKRRKPSRSRLNASDAGDVSDSTGASGLASKTVVRGSLGLFLSSSSSLVFGAGVNFPLAKSVVFDGGGDYVSFGSTFISISLMRFTGGAAYVISTSPDTVFRVGGRAGLARIALSGQLPGFYGEADTNYSNSEMSFYAEGRLAVEKAIGKITISGELQLPLILGTSTTGANSLAIYGGLGFVL
jgi:hypothetical protein